MLSVELKRELLGLQLGFTRTLGLEVGIANTVRRSTVVTGHIPKTLRVGVNTKYSLTPLVLQPT